MVPATLFASPQSVVDVSPSSTQRVPVIHAPPFPKNFDKLAIGSNFVGPTSNVLDMEAIPKTSNPNDLVDRAETLNSLFKVSILNVVDAVGNIGLVTIKDETDAIFINKPPSSLNLESNVPPELFNWKRGPVCSGPAVMDIPELLELAVVSIKNTSSLAPPVSVITNARAELFEILTNESNWAVASISRSPVTSKSFVVVMKFVYPVVPVPNLE